MALDASPNILWATECIVSPCCTVYSFKVYPSVTDTTLSDMFNNSLILSDSLVENISGMDKVYIKVTCVSLRASMRS
ncbi:hypothetical protein D3C78_1588640 [compost metagenome]